MAAKAAGVCLPVGQGQTCRKISCSDLVRHHPYRKRSTLQNVARDLDENMNACYYPQDSCAMKTRCV